MHGLFKSAQRVALDVWRKSTLFCFCVRNQVHGVTVRHLLCLYMVNMLKRFTAVAYLLDIGLKLAALYTAAIFALDK